MSKMSNLVIDIQEAIENGDEFEVIARRFDVPIRWVLKAAKMLDEYNDADPGEMDGDHASALASAGWGTDEDYVWENDYDDSF
jgi:hypothetical protein